ncbi:ScyD/ScyE family protein [Jiangella asiatica]|nr:ScyD/ScyE family protein [Jiangella asiatica]
MVRLSRARAAAALATGVVAVSGVLVGASVAANASGGGWHGSSEPKPVVELDGPRGVAVDQAGRIVVGEADGTISLVIDRGREPKVHELGQVPAGFIAPAVAVSRAGRVFALTTAGEPGTGAATLYQVRPGRSPKVIADIGAYQQDDPDPFDLEDNPTETNPFGLAALTDGSVLVADAAGNDLLRVYPNGHIVTVARLANRVVEVPEELPDEVDGEPLPPAGARIPSEGVATSVTVGSDGYWYVGELRGFPATPGTSQIWRIKPGSVDAVCDPERPNRGDCRRFADGLTSVVDLASGKHGTIYAVQLVNQSWLQWELGLVDPPVGGLIKVRPGGSRSEIAPGSFILPGGVDVGLHGKLYVAAPVFGPGALLRLG